MIDYAQFVSLVKKMRSAQKEYFRYHLTSALEASKRMEREVDKAIEQYEIDNSGQLELFE